MVISLSYDYVYKSQLLTNIAIASIDIIMSGMTPIVYLLY